MHPASRHQLHPGLGVRTPSAFPATVPTGVLQNQLCTTWKLGRRSPKSLPSLRCYNILYKYLLKRIWVLKFCEHLDVVQYLKKNKQTNQKNQTNQDQFKTFGQDKTCSFLTSSISGHLKAKYPKIKSNVFLKEEKAGLRRTTLSRRHDRRFWVGPSVLTA